MDSVCDAGLSPQLYSSRLYPQTLEATLHTDYLCHRLSASMALTHHIPETSPENETDFITLIFMAIYDGEIAIAGYLVKPSQIPSMSKRRQCCVQHPSYDSPTLTVSLMPIFQTRYDDGSKLDHAAVRALALHQEVRRQTQLATTAHVSPAKGPVDLLWIVGHHGNVVSPRHQLAVV